MVILNGLHYDKKEAVEAQRDYCTKNELPMFISSDGVCWSCHRNIFEPQPFKELISGISVEGAGKQLITGCPHCNRSFL